jgi:hypothetical protein
MIGSKIWDIHTAATKEACLQRVAGALVHAQGHVDEVAPVVARRQLRAAHGAPLDELQGGKKARPVKSLKKQEGYASASHSADRRNMPMLLQR